MLHAPRAVLIVNTGLSFGQGMYGSVPHTSTGKQEDKFQ